MSKFQVDDIVISLLPKIGTYTPVEAALSLYHDISNSSVKSYREYAKIWGWGKRRAELFIKRLRGQKGDRRGDKKGTDETCINNDLPPAEGTKRGQRRGQKGDTPDAPFALTPETIEYAKRHGLDDIEIEYQLEKMIANWEGRGKKPKLQSAFTNWITNSYYQPAPPHVREAKGGLPQRTPNHKLPGYMQVMKAKEAERERGGQAEAGQIIDVDFG